MFDGPHLATEGLFVVIYVIADGFQFLGGNSLQGVAKDLQPLVHLDDRVLLHLRVVDHHEVVLLLVVELRLQVFLVQLELEDLLFDNVS